ncbi:hypothetical protein GUJ93_ZPchr0001g32104 [Zizania palustris]|uniref:BTB domain-containing protein n=1 Tax=Zizania palustris TaxID=103762 RepID=A0A8J5RQW4_ZIZPA|nr:hypothetical protein GUJ93_ZPchr0001g32104 [Zizania palustris]
MCQAPRAAGDASAAADVDVVTSGGRRRIPAHSSVLASASPVLESILQRRLKKHRDGGKAGRAVVRIRGVTDDAAAAFVRLLYAGSSGCGGEEEEIEEKSAAQVLVLAHAYRVPWLKRRCEEEIGSRLTAESVVDATQLAGLCDAPALHLRCTRLLAKEFKAVEKTEAWRFLQDNDPWLELDILQRLHDADLRRRKWRRKREEAAGVRGAERGDGLPAPHLHGGVHGGGPGGAGAGGGAVPGVRDGVPGTAAADPPLLPVPPHQLPALPAHVAAAPPPRRALRPPRRPVQHPSLHAVQAQGGGEGGGEGR